MDAEKSIGVFWASCDVWGISLQYEDVKMSNEKQEKTIDEPSVAVADEFATIVNELNKETDRAAVILSVAKIDQMLGEIIKCYLLPCPGSHDDLVDGDAPLGTLSARINMAHRLGLIDAEFARALHITRRIRNEFAHELSSSSLGLGSNRDRVR